MKMKALQFYSPLNVVYEDVEIKDPKEGEVQVQIKAALTCGTDVKTYRRGHPVLIKKVPSGFGHEFSGIITKVGKNVAGFNVGDRVVAANSAPCGECFFCKNGEYNLCEKLEFLNGAYAEYINVPKSIVKRNLLKLPDDLSFEKAAFAEPLANVVHGIEKTGIKEGQTVGVVGLGPIGLMFVKLVSIQIPYQMAMSVHSVFRNLPVCNGTTELHLHKSLFLFHPIPMHRYGIQSEHLAASSWLSFVY